ncbi:hypothetical protein [Gulosibacter molinativorax]|uniref:TetR/AcrR family transcriptional regulator n=1 Tax=Gulosibacter molinativorax TaxID=256821 RepID=A0ABT7C5W9_9MICO|nr:hypothetical protein [Gulosibacter molinativorax]MDJ1370578.1 hypothetical protein [Gulosibacter molinativorax]QUY62006.1 Hypotetical protein [Gulosibacter molinativorax]
MTRETEIYAALVPATSELRIFAARALISIQRELDALREEYASLSVALEVGNAADLYTGLADRARESEGVEPHAKFDALLADLWRETRGRDQHEQLFSVYLNAGFIEDALRHWGGSELDDLLGWDEGQESLVAVFKTLFDLDTTLDDRIAMWGRRIAGAAVLWSRRIVGVEAGQSPDDVIDGADQIVEAMVTELFAQHSRRMNALALAA